MNKLNKLYDLGSKDSIDVQSLKSTAKKLAKFSPALMLAGVVPAEAQVICNDNMAPIVVTPGTYYGFNFESVDLDGDGNIDFYVGNGTTFYYGQGAVLNPASNAIGSATSASSYLAPANLSSGSIIGPGATFATYNTLAAPNFSWGNFNPPANGFVGLAFDISGETHYGWMELSNDGTDITIEGFCYESTPNTAIAAGERMAIVPTLGEWGLISLNLLLMIFGVVAVKEQGRIAIKQKVK